MSIDDATRRQIADLARRPHKRTAKSKAAHPTDWQPQQVRNPDAPLDPPFDKFTEAGAWELIASSLENGHDVEVIKLLKPPGAKGYVMKIALEGARPLLYVKLQLRHGRLIGRSFHYSEY